VGVSRNKINSAVLWEVIPRRVAESQGAGEINYLHLIQDPAEIPDDFAKQF
jgi:hypothetical protein